LLNVLKGADEHLENKLLNIIESYEAEYGKSF